MTYQAIGHFRYQSLGHHKVIKAPEMKQNLSWVLKISKHTKRKLHKAFFFSIKNIRKEMLNNEDVNKSNRDGRKKLS